MKAVAEYRKDLVYIELERLIEEAGVHITYEKVHDDSIDGAIWARSDYNTDAIMMPDTDEFPDAQTACLILGHEMGHILSRIDSPDDPVERRKNEAEVDLIGVYLFKLAERIAGEKQEKLYRL